MEAKTIGRDLPISSKHAVEVCSFIRGKTIKQAKERLQKVLERKMAVRFTRYNMDIGHKTGVGPARYADKTVKHVLALIRQLEANAEVKGLNSDALYLKEVIPNKASRPFRYGRIRGRRARRTHITLVAAEKK